MRVPVNDLGSGGRRVVVLVVLAAIIGGWELWAADYGSGGATGASSDRSPAAVAVICDATVDAGDRIRYTAGFDYYVSDTGLGRC